MRNRKLKITTLHDRLHANRLGQFEPIINAILAAVPGFFGGRSQQQIRQDELNSIAANKQGYYNSYGITLDDATVAGILAPGWNVGEDGTQLWHRMETYHNTHQGGGGSPSPIESKFPSIIFIGLALAAYAIYKKRK